MPIYEYRCGACGHTLDALQKLADAPLKDCPECEQPSLKRLMSAPAFRLKGGGWYETDFKSDKETKRNLANRAEAAPAGGDKSNGSDGSKSSDAKSTDGAKGRDGAKGSDGARDSGAAKGAGAAKGSQAAKTDNAKSTARKDSGGGSSNAAA